MQLHWGVCVSILLVPVSILAQDQSGANARASGLLPPSRRRADTLPVRRVVLYKSGVGYFEHLGTVRGNQDVTVPFTSGQLNDVLKSLTVLDSNGGRIAGVEYDSIAPVDRQLGDLRLPVGRESHALRFPGGAAGRAPGSTQRNQNSITGRLLSIERKTRISGGTTLEVDYMSLLTDKGELKTTELSPAFSVRLLDSRACRAKWIAFSTWFRPAAKRTCVAW